MLYTVGIYGIITIRAGVVELADTLDLGSNAKAYGFKSLHLHQFKPSANSAFIIAY